MSITLKEIAASLAIAASSLFVTGAASQDKVVIRIDGNVVRFYAPLYAGVENGIFRTKISKSNFFTQVRRTS